MGSTYVFLHIRRNFISKDIILSEGKSIRFARLISTDFDKKKVVVLLMLVGSKFDVSWVFAFF
jgi:hypothetical protein